MCNIKVSVIMPVYNAEKHLRQCLDSVVNQTLQEIEIICVDDGSTDSSPAILAEYAAADSRFQVCHQQNLYAGVARNNGMRHASGKYLAFWDSDDYFYPEALEKMYAKAEEDQADICLCDANQYYEGIGFETTGGMYLVHKHLPAETPFSRKSCPDVILNVINAAPWTKLFRRSFVAETGLLFQPVRNGNDVYFVECMLALAEAVTYVDEPLLCYRRNQSDSLVGTLSSAPTAPVDAWISIYDTLRKKNALPVKSFHNKVMNSMIYMLRNASGSFPAFSGAFEYLQRVGLTGLGLDQAVPSDFFNPWDYDCLTHMKQDSAEEFMAYLFHYTYIKLTEANARRVKQTQKASENKEKLKAVKADLKQALSENRKQKQELEALHSDNEKLQSEVEKLQKKLEETLNSNSYKVGHALMWLPGKIKNG